MNKGKLYVIPIVIAEDTSEVIPQQVRRLITQLDYFLVENIRTARRFISSLKLGITIEDLTFHVLDKKTSAQSIGTLLAPITQGRNIGIMSESGCPGIADPGAMAVAYAHRHGIEVIPLVGPSSLLLALMGSGFNGQKFCFHGYLPIDNKPLENEIKRLESESAKHQQTQLFIETPYRNNQLLKTILKVAKPTTHICVAKNLTATDQLLLTKTVAEWQNSSFELHKVPTVFLLYAGNLS